jgi:hypothetical protein
LFTDALNQIYPSYASKSSGTQAQPPYAPEKQAEEVRHLSKYIFPAQYGMQSAFQYISARKGDQYPNYLDREKDIEVSFSVLVPLILLMSPHRSLVVAKLPSDSKKSFLSLTS